MPVPISDTDRRLAQLAATKQAKGQRPRKDEQRALERVKAHVEEAKRWEHYRTTPKKHLLEMAGRQAKVVNDMAGRYGIPALGSPVDLTAFVRWAFDFLAANSKRLNADDESGVDSPALERQREEQAKILRIRRLQLERVLIPRATIHEIMSRVAVVLRSAGETLEKKHGPEARATLDEALDDAERELAALADPADGQHPID